jgi:cytochrome c oxidase subunit 3
VAADHHAGPVAHHFDNLKQQQATVRFGIWLFLVTEVLFFGGVLCAYTAYRIWFPTDFEAGSAALNVGIATVNTFLLLASSLTITLGIGSAYRKDTTGLRRWLLATILLGSVFLGLKMREYYLDYEEGLIPGPPSRSVILTDEKTGEPLKDAAGRVRTVNRELYFVTNLGHVLDHAGYKYVFVGDPYVPSPDSPDYPAYEKKLAEARESNGAIKQVNPVRVQLFFMFYYSMTGLHVLHMVIGIGLLAWQYLLARQGFFDSQPRYVYVEVMALYWHFVDMVWIFLLPLLYLAGPHNWGQVGTGLQQAFGMSH